MWVSRLGTTTSLIERTDFHMVTWEVVRRRRNARMAPKTLTLDFAGNETST